MGYVFIDTERRVIEVLQADDLPLEMLAPRLESRHRWVYLGMQKDLHVESGRPVSDLMIQIASGEPTPTLAAAPAPAPERSTEPGRPSEAQAWTYTLVEMDPTARSSLQATLNTMGSDGWELVHVHDNALSGPSQGYLLFKRRVEQPLQPANGR